MSGCIRWIRGGGHTEVSESSVVLLPYRPASVAAARYRLAAELRQAGVADPAVGDASLVLTELLSNAILHASPLVGTTVRVTWALAAGWVEVAVSDGGGETEPQTQHPPPSATGGRGLAIVEHLCHSWGVHTGDHGTTVWAVMPAPEDAGPGLDAAGQVTAPGRGTTGQGAPGPPPAAAAPLTATYGDRPAPVYDGPGVTRP
jgi:anti-sigma regulatory factor (Ser/Thr protein kinase)